MHILVMGWMFTVLMLAVGQATLGAGVTVAMLGMLPPVVMAWFAARRSRRRRGAANDVAGER